MSVSNPNLLSQEIHTLSIYLTGASCINSDCVLITGSLVSSYIISPVSSSTPTIALLVLGTVGFL